LLQYVLKERERGSSLLYRFTIKKIRNKQYRRINNCIRRVHRNITKSKHTTETDHPCKKQNSHCTNISKLTMVRTFENYREAKKHFLTLSVGRNTSFGYNTDDKVPAADKFHDVMLCLYMSDLIYTIGILRSKTRDLGYTLETLKEELIYLFGKDRDGKDGLARLLTGKFKLKDEDGDGFPDPPDFDFKDLEKFIEDPKFEKFTTPAFVSRCANGLTVASMESFKNSSVLLYKFDAKFDQNDLVYAIAVRKKDSHNDLILTFRGSSTPRDWMQNFQAPLVDILLHQVGDKAYFVEGNSRTPIEIDIGLYKKLDKALSLEDAVDGQSKRIPIKVHQGKFRCLYECRHGAVPLPPNQSTNSNFLLRYTKNVHHFTAVS
jgi:hypothetical protein